MQNMVILATIMGFP